MPYPTQDSAGGEYWTRKEAHEESGKRSEKTEMRSDVPRRAEKRKKMEGRRQRQRRGNENFPGMEVALQHAGMDSVGCESSSMWKEAKEESGKMRKEANEESGKRSEMQYTWMKRPEESEASYVKRLRRLKEPANGDERRKYAAMGPARGQRLARDTDIARRQRETKPKVEAKDAQAFPVTTDAGKPRESVTEAGKAEESLTVGSGKQAMDQEALNVEILKKVYSDSYIPDEADMAMLKEQEERAAWIKEITKNSRWMKDLPTKMTKPAADPNSMTIQDDHVDKAKSALAKKIADKEAKDYASFRERWQSKCCIKGCDHFGQKTILGSMPYTHCIPGNNPYSVVRTLQIFSMKLKPTEDNAGGFEFPLSVYGFVAVRDSLDSRRNILFSCNRTEAQELTQDDPFLLLTGPSRAIVSMDSVYFEIYLVVKGAAGSSRDKPLMTCVSSYNGGNDRPSCFGNPMCTLEVFARTVESAVQATILCVQIVEKNDISRPSNFKHGGLVACTPVPMTRMTADSGSNQKIVLTESKGRKLPQCDIGYVHLWRQVVSVEGGGGLDVSIQAYKQCGAVGAKAHVHFRAQNCLMSQQQCIVGQAQVNVTVAWSIVPTDMEDLVYDSTFFG